MFEIPNLITFVIASVVLVVVPGPAVMFIVAKSMDKGKGAGLIATLGIHLGTMVHIIAAALGLSAILATSAIAFNIVKFIGAGYLIFLGIKTLFFEKGKSKALEIEESKRGWLSLFMQGMLVNIMNPKTALFFLAFLPQFVVIESVINSSYQIMILGGIFIIVGLISDSIYALIAGSVSNWLKNSNVLKARTQQYFSGITYVILGVVTLFTAPGKK